MIEKREKFIVTVKIEADTKDNYKKAREVARKRLADCGSNIRVGIRGFYRWFPLSARRLKPKEEKLLKEGTSTIVEGITHIKGGYIKL
ncbi:MAG: hypothetical protein WC942_10950 [Clostridia bacterium]|jgi:hypothetical protein